MTHDTMAEIATVFVSLAVLMRAAASLVRELKKKK